MASELRDPTGAAANVIRPDREGWEHFACPVCGDVFMLPWERGEEHPYCTHAERPVWHAPGSPSTNWARMTRAEVRAIED